MSARGSSFALNPPPDFVPAFKAARCADVQMPTLLALVIMLVIEGVSCYEIASY